MITCRACREPGLQRVLDLGKVPAADHFPSMSEPVSSAETAHELAMDLCGVCGLAQLADDDTVADEPRGVEPEALRNQAAEAIALVAGAGWLAGDTVLEFGSPHGGTWLPLLTERGFRSVPSNADVVLDCFGIMHEPDQHAAFAHRAQTMSSRGVLLLQFHSIMTIIGKGQWNALRHGHFAYYSLTTLTRLLATVGLSVATAWEFDLYGGTVLIGAVRGSVEPDESVRGILAAESDMGIERPSAFERLQVTADRHVHSLRTWLDDERDAGRTIAAYGAASRAVALFSRAGLDSGVLTMVADASPSKQGRRMPGTDIPIGSPDELLASMPDQVLLTIPDLLPEVSDRFPELNGRWRIDGQ
jgi:C-methyltransferase-like protein/putative zinc binding protein